MNSYHIYDVRLFFFMCVSFFSSYPTTQKSRTAKRLKTILAAFQHSYIQHVTLIEKTDLLLKSLNADITIFTSPKKKEMGT